MTIYGMIATIIANKNENKNVNRDEIETKLEL